MSYVVRTKLSFLCLYIWIIYRKPSTHRSRNSCSTNEVLLYLGLLQDARLCQDSDDHSEKGKKTLLDIFFCSGVQLGKLLTCFLNCWHSSGVRVSALAISGMTLTFSCNRFMNSMSKGFSLQWDKDSTLQGVQAVSNHVLTLCTLYLVLIYCSFFSYHSSAFKYRTMNQTIVELVFLSI